MFGFWTSRENELFFDEVALKNGRIVGLRNYFLKQKSSEKSCFSPEAKVQTYSYLLELTQNENRGLVLQIRQAPLFPIRYPGGVYQLVGHGDVGRHAQCCVAL